MRKKRIPFLIILGINILASLYFTAVLLNSYGRYRTDQPQISWGESLIIKPNQKYTEIIHIDPEKKLNSLLLATKASGEIKAKIEIQNNPKVDFWEVNQNHSEWGFIDLKLTKKIVKSDSLKLQIENTGNTNLNLPKTAFINNVKIPNHEIFLTPIYSTKNPLEIISSRIGNNLNINVDKNFIGVTYILLLGNFIFIYTHFLNKYLNFIRAASITVIFWFILIYNIYYLNTKNMLNFGAYISYETIKK